MSVREKSSPLPAVELDAVARRFGRRWALRGISLRVPPGEALAIVGHNGCGKSTLLRVIATLLRPTLGGGRVYGRDLVREPDAVRSLVGMLGHAPAVYGDLTAEENLLFAARMFGIADDRRQIALAIAAALDAVGLAREANERARNFSSGMQRRLSLARVLLRPPRLLLLDEPYHSFDAAGAVLVNDLVRATRARDAAVLMVTHDLARTEGLIDRVVEMRAGALARPAEPPAGAAADTVDDGVVPLHGTRRNAGRSG